jgi:hypothetical protein
MNTTETQPPDSLGAATGSAIRRCEKCNREGQLVDQAAQPGSKHGPPSMHYAPWVFRYYLCRWDRAAWNRTRLDGQKKMTVLEYRPDSELLPNVAVSDKAAPGGTR